MNSPLWDWGGIAKPDRYLLYCGPSPDTPTLRATYTKSGNKLKIAELCGQTAAPILTFKEVILDFLSLKKLAPNSHITYLGFLKPIIIFFWNNIYFPFFKPNLTSLPGNVPFEMSGELNSKDEYFGVRLFSGGFQNSSTVFPSSCSPNRNPNTKLRKTDVRRFETIVLPNWVSYKGIPEPELFFKSSIKTASWRCADVSVCP